MKFSDSMQNKPNTVISPLNWPRVFYDEMDAAARTDMLEEAIRQELDPENDSARQQILKNRYGKKEKNGMMPDRYMQLVLDCVFAANQNRNSARNAKRMKKTLEDLDADATLTLEAQAEAPVFDLAEGCYAEAQTLSITGPEGAALYYSLDGSAPDEDSLLYEEPIQLTEGCTVCAAALLPGAELSEITRAEYAFVTITAPELPDGTQGEEPPEAAAFTVENPGKTPAVIESVSLSGKSASYFSLSTEEGGTVKAGKSDSKTWTLRPAADLTRGNYRATVIFTLAGGQTVQLDVRYKVK